MHHPGEQAHQCEYERLKMILQKANMMNKSWPSLFAMYTNTKSRGREGGLKLVLGKAGESLTPRWFLLFSFFSSILLLFIILGVQRNGLVLFITPVNLLSDMQYNRP